MVNLVAPYDKKIGAFSGGQQARLLLASALIQDPDLLLLDEPTNNLDKAGITHLTQFLIDYKKTLLVISHDAEFLNSFSDGVLYLDAHTKHVEQYVGDYDDVVSTNIRAHREGKPRQRAPLQRDTRKQRQGKLFCQQGRPNAHGGKAHARKGRGARRGKT